MKPLPTFLMDFVQRLFTANPQFFKYIQVVSGIIALIAFMPDLFSMLALDAPSWLGILNEKAIKVGAIITMFVAQLPNKPV